MTEQIKPAGPNQTLPKIRGKLTVLIINPRDCSQCGRKFKPPLSDPNAEECDECRGYLDAA